MSAIYRFGFEHAFVPSGVTAYGNYLYIGREGNCSLYGNWPKVDCELEPTNKIRGSFAALSYANDLKDIKNQYHVDFGPVRLKQHLSGHISIEISGNRVASIGGFDVKRGYWYPIQFLIEPGRVEFIYDTYPLVYEGTFSFDNQNTIRIGGLGGTGCLEDISLNSATGINDTGIPTLYAGVPLFYSGSTIKHFNYIDINNSIDRYDELSTGLLVSEINASQYAYSPIDNRVYFGSNSYGSGTANAIFLNLNDYSTGAISGINYLQNGQTRFVMNAFTYCPSTNTVFCISGGNSTPTISDIVEIDPLTNRKLRSYRISSTVAPIGCSMIYNDYLDSLIFNIGNSSSNFYKFNCATKDITQLSITGSRTCYQQWNVDYLGNVFFLYYNSSFYTIEKVDINTYYQSRKIFYCPASSFSQNNNRILIDDKLGSGFIGLKNSSNSRATLILFNKDDISQLVSGAFHQYSSASYSQPFFYEKINNTLFFQKSIINLADTGNFTSNNFEYSNNENLSINYGSSIYDYIPTKHSLIISQTSLGTPLQRYMEYDLVNKTIKSGFSGLHDFYYIQNNDSLSIKTDYDDANGHLYITNNNLLSGFQGTNIVSRFRKERKNESSLTIGINNQNNLQTIGRNQPNLGGNIEKSYSLLNNSGIEDISIYFKYDRNLGILDGE